MALPATAAKQAPNCDWSGVFVTVRGLLSELSHVDGMGDLVRLQYGHDAEGNITSIDDLITPANDRTFVYDELDRVISGGTVSAPETYVYDEEGNRTSSHLSPDAIPDVSDDLNRLLEDDTFTYVYASNGNLISKTDKATLDLTTYTYDAFDRLVRADLPGGLVTTYAYDALGRRIEKTAGVDVTRYVYDGQDIVLEYDASSGSSVLVSRFAHGPLTDQPLAMERGSQSYYYHANHQSSVIRITDALGTTVNEYDYDSYGNALVAIESIDNPYRYTGREWDSEGGVLFYRTRSYDPTTGRFLQQDPIGFVGGDANLYRYVENNPVNLSDPFGMQGAPVGDPYGLGGLLTDIGEAIAVASQCEPEQPLPPGSGAIESLSLIEDVALLFVGGTAGKGAITRGARFVARLPFVNRALVFFKTGGVSVSRLSAAAKVPSGSKGLSVAGRALTKHDPTKRAGAVFPPPVGSPEQINRQAQAIVDRILNDPGTVVNKRDTGRFGPVTEFFSPSGEGIRYSRSGDFITFLEP